MNHFVLRLRLQRAKWHYSWILSQPLSISLPPLHLDLLICQMMILTPPQ